MVSVNTNLGASIALQALNQTNRQLDATQKRISTGFRVADAKDDGAAFAVAQGLRAQIKGNEAVTERLAMTKGLLSVSLDAVGKISDRLGDIRHVVVKMADENLTTAQRNAYLADYRGLRNDILKYINQSTFNGVNLMNTNPNVVTIINNTGGTYTIQRSNVSNGVSVNLPNSLLTAGAAQTMLQPGGGIEGFEHYVTSAFTRFSAAHRALSSQENMINNMQDAIHFGLGAVVDADLAKDSAKLQSLQIRQQLGTQALSLANRAPSALISLFR